MVDDVPVPVVVLGMEAGHAQGGGVGHRPGQLLGGGPLLRTPVERGHDLGRVVAQDGPGQTVDGFRIRHAGPRP